MARDITRFAIVVAKLAEIRIVIPAKTNKIRLASKLTGSHTLAPSLLPVLALSE